MKMLKEKNFKNYILKIFLEEKNKINKELKTTKNKKKLTEDKKDFVNQIKSIF